MKTVLLLLAFLLAPFAAYAQGCGPSNPQCIVTTAPVGTNNNQAASTAFVQNQFGSPPVSSLGTGAGFYFDKNGSNQTGLTTGVYNRITWSTTKFNTTTNALSGNLWTAPVAGLIYFNASIWCSLNCLNTPNSGNPIFVVKIIKNSAGTCNGSDVFAGVGAPGLGGGVNQATAQANGVDQAAANDVYEVCVFPTSSDAMNDVQIDGNAAHTHWSGHYIR